MAIDRLTNGLTGYGAEVAGNPVGRNGQKKRKKTEAIRSKRTLRMYNIHDTVLAFNTITNLSRD